MDRRILLLSCVCLTLWSAGCAPEKPAAAPAAAQTPSQPAATPPAAGVAASQSHTKTPPPEGATVAADQADNKDAGQTGSEKEKSGKEKTGQDGQSGKVIHTASGLEIQDMKVGKGPMPRTGQRVFVDYIGSLSDGTEFDTSFNNPNGFSFVLGEGKVIKGWDEGVATMHVGGKRILVVPPQLGYGPMSQGKIPANSTLTFIIDLHSIGKE